MANAARSHASAFIDWGDVETIGFDVFGNPAALGRVVGEVEGFDEDLILSEGGKLCGY